MGRAFGYTITKNNESNPNYNEFQKQSLFSYIFKTLNQQFLFFYLTNTMIRSTKTMNLSTIFNEAIQSMFIDVIISEFQFEIHCFFK